MAIVAFLFGGRMTVGTPTSLLLLLYMAFISSAAYTLWGVLLKYHPVSHVTVFNFVTPVAGVLLSSVILSEHGVLNGSVSSLWYWCAAESWWFLGNNSLCKILLLIPRGGIIQALLQFIRGWTEHL